MERVWLDQYPKGVPSDIDLEAYGSIGELVSASFDRYRSKTALISMKTSITFDELDRQSRELASYWQNAARLPAGARIAVMMPNLLQYPIAVLAALRAGYVVVNCNPLYTPRELHHQLVDSGAEAIVVVENFAHVLEQALPGTKVDHIVVTGVGDRLGAAKGAFVNLMLRHVRKAVPAWDLPGVVWFNQALALGKSGGLLVEAIPLPKITWDSFT